MHVIKKNTDSHNHHNDIHEHHSHDDIKNISVAFFLNFTFTIVEFIGGVYTNSMAILSDAIHDLGDSISLGLAWYFQKVSKRKSDIKFSYGYKRFSLLGALINAVILSVGSIIILIETIPRIFHPQETMVEGMFVLAILGILVNGAAVLRLKKGKSMNEKVVSLHLWEDVLGWAAILIGSVLMYFFNWSVIDPLLSIFISLFILKHVYQNIRQTLRIILQGVPEEIDIQEIEGRLGHFQEIENIHDLHVWSIDGNFHVLSVHILLKKEYTNQESGLLKNKIREALALLHIEHATIEFEFPGEKCDFINCCR